MDLLAEQIRLEEEARARHREGWLDNIRDAMESGRAGAVPFIQRMTVAAYPTVEAKVLDILNDGSRGPGAQYRTYMRSIGARACACLALSMAVTGAASNQPVAQLLRDMGKALMAEVVYSAASKSSSKGAVYMGKVAKDVRRNKSKSPNHIYNKARGAARNLGVDVDTMPARAFISIGKLLMQAVEPTGLVTTEKVGGSARMRGTARFCLAADVIATMQDWVGLPSADGYCCPPMIVPPRQIAPDGKSGMWQSPAQAATYRVVSRMRHATYAKLKVGTAAVAEACMMLSSVPYRINPMVLEFLRHNRTGCMGLPVEPAEPKLPFTIPAGVSFDQYISQFPEQMQQTMQAQAHEFKVKTRLWHEEMKKFSSQMFVLNGSIREADIYAKYSHVYMPTHADTRGRIYYSSILNPQSIDAVRAMLELAEPVPLGEDGLFWLKVHVANCFGYDATDFTDRAAWTDKTLPRLREACRLPEAYNTFWEEADYPMCAWAAACELIAAIDSPDHTKFPSRVITHWDATCSGMQHLSAMFRDEVGGAAVNLIDSPGRKADIYLITAAAALRTLQEREGVQSTHLGQWMLSTGIARNMAKKPVMTYVYSATLRGMTDHFCLYLRKEGVKLAAGSSLLDCARALAELMWESIPKAVPKAAAAMAWLQEVARAAAEKGEYVEWDAPSGHHCINLYQATKETRMSLHLMGVHGIKLYNYLDKPDSRKCAAAIAPNFVHSMDASHMMRVLWALWNLGIYMVSIHDSFGVAAGHAGVLHKVIREQFVKMYTECDPVKDLEERYGIKAPERGNLDLELVKTSSKFFC
nr:MAG: DNA-dependent RNA polymerase [Bacteriophage sp.]